MCVCMYACVESYSTLMNAAFYRTVNAFVQCACDYKWMFCIQTHNTGSCIQNILYMCGAIAEYFKHLFCARAIAITMRVHSTNEFGEQNYFYACTLVV